MKTDEPISIPRDVQFDRFAVIPEQGIIISGVGIV
jgi:hypothetical protein